eukprot:CAMPEP_0117046340 /NCGR_PEP_ID=MMETSP0472-20121206/32044_1 /TAXON_ID=693140 ORGANISM="Tiarina fusus, Strain LIS" /NCGR_SAMPLE_ID=MMETSP0472 /ASSEMBLY_ACC=CAM_ASM_000603 /LENGTH=788 /DNA_ID=CAMNT_0004758659 /DNA_START=210 /DNA_END=2576 /DNA_ORIENTATION=-
MAMIPPRHYCVIANPVIRKEDGSLDVDADNNPRLKHGDEEIRGEQEPFPLYPGESLVGKISPLQVVAANAALRLRCIRDFTDKTEVERQAGDEWLFHGPGTYYPAVEVQVVEIIKSTIIKENQALKLRARRKMVDSHEIERQAGEEWLIRTPGAYLPGVDEEVVDQVRAHVLTDKKALHLRSKRTFKDVQGVERKAGQEWLVTIADAETHIPDVYEEVVGEVRITTLNNRQYAVVLDPVDENGNNKLGKKELVKGERSFFLRPGERLENGIQHVHVLDGEEALLLRAKENFTDASDDTQRKPGDKWMITGPCDYIPPIEVEILEKRRVIPLDENEGIYVRDLNTGKVRSVIGEAYMLKSNEELWEKELPDGVEELLQQREYSGNKAGARKQEREKTRVVTYRAPHNSAVQVYDYTSNQSRVQFGPDLVMLGPDEHFTLISLSGGKPKRQDVIKSICVLLGPDFMTDIVTVETSDHARLSLQLAYNWHFDVDKSGADEEASVKIFSVPDFVGDACKSIASRVRGAVASTSFDDFHKQSAECIRCAVFGTDADGVARPHLKFAANNLVITGIDIQSVEPIDQRTRDSLQKSVQLAIEITTKSQEATARHDAQRKEQEARGKLERQKINDESEAEEARKQLLTLQAQSAAVESTGHAAAEAKARAEAAKIEGEAAVQQATLRAEASKIKSQAELEQTKKRQLAEITHQNQINNLELSKAQKLAEIEAAKFAEIVEAIGAETIQQIARAGPEMQAKLLGGLGLKGIMITDGNSPINMFNTAKGLIGGGMSTE